MALPDHIRAQIVEEAERRGVDPGKALAHAEALSSPAPGPGDPRSGSAAPMRPLAESLLIGHLPFVKVRELRQLWLGLDERITGEINDEMTCGEFQLAIAQKYGGAPSAGGDSGATPEDDE